MSLSFSVNFTYNHTAHSVPGGGRFELPREVGFRDASTGELESIQAEVSAGAAWREVVARRFADKKPWLHSIITDSSRTAFFDSVLPPGDGLALDLGAGWGQIARPLAARRPVVALEPVAERLGFIAGAARQDGVHDRIAYLQADYLELEFQTRFSVVCAIGVLEWVGAFQSQKDPQERQRDFLRKVKSDLAAGGSLVLGIENRIGLKYLLGCPDDHIGVPGVACLPASLARARWHAATGAPLNSFTYSPNELRQMLSEAGFSHMEFFGAFPDYKLPRLILPFGSDGEPINRWLADHDAPLEHNGYDGSALPKQQIEVLNAHYRTLAAEGTAHTFCPSFFIRAS